MENVQKVIRYLGANQEHIHTIYLDMDGVIANFVDAALEVHSDRSGVLTHNDITDWHMEEWLGITVEEFWKPLNNYDFWRYDVKPYSYAETLFDVCSAYGEVYICTSPTLFTGCVTAKLDWLTTFFGWGVDRVITMGHKELLAKPGTCLIDDRKSSVFKFQEAGGFGIVFEQPWSVAS